MPIPRVFLDQLRERVSMSSLVGKAVQLVKAGKEHKACCPFHSERTPSFTVNDDKGFAHCFSCGWHGDAFKWMADYAGTPFPDAVRELAAIAGLEVPQDNPATADWARKIETVRGALETAQGAFVDQLAQAGAVMEYLSARGIVPADIETFGIGYARGDDGSLRSRGIGTKLGIAAGLLAEREDKSVREVFHDRVTIPIHDAGGRLIGFGGRVWPGRRGDTPKFVNSPESPVFDKGRTLFNLHRAAQYARPQAENRLIIVEGYFDVVSLARVGIRTAAAPMGTALTPAQLKRAWRVHHRPILLLDGDGAGLKAAVRACETALPAAAPGHELAVAVLPEGRDPDDLANDGGADAVEEVLAGAIPMHEFLFDAVLRGAA